MSGEWDTHWGNHRYDPLLNVSTPENWSDFQWKFTLVKIQELINFKFYHNGDNKISMLECGAGTASVSRFIYKTYSNQIDVTVIDNSEEAINVANLFIDSDKISIKAIQCSIDQMPFSDNRFDIIFLGGVMEYLDDIQACTNEIKRVLKPGGILLFVVVPNILNIQIVGDILIRIRWFFSKKNLGKKLVPNVVKKWDAVKYADMLKNLEFTDIQIQYLNPFPQLPLPGKFKKLYVSLIGLFEKRILQFNQRSFRHQKYFSISFIIKCNKHINE